MHRSNFSCMWGVEGGVGSQILVKANLHMKGVAAGGVGMGRVPNFGQPNLHMRGAGGGRVRNFCQPNLHMKGLG